MSTARKLSEKVHHHLREEEKKFFQVSGRMLTERQKQVLLGRYERDYRRSDQVPDSLNGTFPGRSHRDATVSSRIAPSRIPSACIWTP